ncbi:MAG: hypothetical protein JSV58_05870 [Candidatus Bathyarchaeota archaeon]|nr:MAG: hypothetical protein JSV58_05870 [Candidatus Bathyarchaeota archaeon]
MSRAKVTEDKIEVKNRVFSSFFLEMENAVLILLSEGENRLGTLAVAIPSASKTGNPPLSSILLGDRNVMTARSLAERFVKKMNKIILLSIFVRSMDEREVAPALLKLAEKSLTS